MLLEAHSPARRRANLLPPSPTLPSIPSLGISPLLASLGLPSSLLLGLPLLTVHWPVPPQAGKKDSKRVIAGKETGCKFFLLFHTGFVSADGALPVPLAMMDKAFKNKKNKYNVDGVATLRFELQ